MTKFVVYSRHTLQHYIRSVTTDCECVEGKHGYKYTKNLVWNPPNNRQKKTEKEEMITETCLGQQTIKLKVEENSVWKGMLDDSECDVDRWRKLGGWKGNKTGCTDGRWLKMSTSYPVAFFVTLLAVFIAGLARSERWLFIAM